MMNKCISCTCTGYKPPILAKGTFLQFKQNCEECGHQASEHRKLTAVDQYIKSEVARGKRSKCSALILPCDIPISPVFSQYDLIPLPRDNPSYTPSMENSVECTCKGFKTPDVIRLCQKFRTYKLSDVAVELVEIPCTFCNHPISSHTPTPVQGGCTKTSNSIFMNAMKPAIGVYEGLTLCCSSLLVFPPVNSNCLELILPANFSDVFMLLSLGNFQDSDMLMLAVASEALSQSTVEDKSLGTLGMKVSGGDVTFAKKRLKGKQSNVASKRRSRRVATKKVREEQVKVLKQLKGLKGIGGGVDGDPVSEEVDQVEYTELEYRQVLEMTTSFTKKIVVPDNYHTYHLPQGMLDTDVRHPVMAALQITAQDTDRGQDSMDTNQSRTLRGILVAVGTKEGSAIFLAVIPPEKGESGDVLTWEEMNPPGTGTLECLVLREVRRSESDAEEDEVLVAAGMSSGMVYVWKAVLAEGRTQLKGRTAVVTEFNCGSQCVALNCSPDNKFLVAGTLSGEAVFCPLTSVRGIEQSLPRLPTIQCCSAPIKCITWSDDGRLLAVGACDDVIQVLQCVTPLEVEPLNKSSLLNYFKRTDSYKLPKIIHTHTLKGHTSFVADLIFVSGYLLVSVGWDSQLLFWRLYPIITDQVQGRPHRLKGKSEQPELVDPVGGYKLGPSLMVEFLPLLLRSMMGCGLVVAMANKLGGVTLAGYARLCQ